MRLFAALLGLLILAPAAQAASPVYKVSAYGVQRITTSSSATATGRCFDERGASSSSVVIRFKTPRALRARFVDYGPVAAMLPVGTTELALAGTVERSASANMEKASCADLNPDGSQKWVPVPPPAQECARKNLDEYTASISLSGRKLTFDVQRPLLSSLDCPDPDIDTVSKRVSTRQLLEADGAPIRIQKSFSETVAAPDGSSTSTTKKLTTVYIEVHRIG
jgi:hypothetical protein